MCDHQFRVAAFGSVAQTAAAEQAATITIQNVRVIGVLAVSA
jgi:hypothetical protein